MSEEIVKHVCVAIKGSEFRWLSFIEGYTYLVGQIKYSNGEIDKTHVSVEGTWRHRDGALEDRRIPIAKIMCKEFLKKKEDAIRSESSQGNQEEGDGG